MTHPDNPNRAVQMAGNLLARGFSVFCAVAAVWWLWRSLRRPLGEWPAALAAAALGLSLGLMNIAHFATPEACLLLLVTLALGAFITLGQTGRLRDAIAAGVWFGFSCSTKYTAVLLVLPLTWALFPLARRDAPGRAFRLWAITGAVGVVAFFAATPYALLHWRSFVTDGLIFTWRTGAPANSLVGVQRTWAVYAQHLAGALGWPLFVFFVGSCLWWASRPAATPASQQTLSVHALWIAGFWGFLGLSPHQAMRFIIPLVPSVAVFAGWGAGRLLERSEGLRSRRIVRAGLSAMFLYTAVYTAAGVYWFVNDTRYAAGDWLKWHMRPESAVTYFAIESYLPYWDRPWYSLRFRPEVWPSRARDADFDAWRRTTFQEMDDVIVDTNFFYHRFLLDPERWPGRDVMYRDLLADQDPAGYRLVARFEQHDPWWLHANLELVAPTIVIFAKPGQIRK